MDLHCDRSAGVQRYIRLTGFFPICTDTQDIVVVVSGVKPLISPTYR